MKSMLRDIIDAAIRERQRRNPGLTYPESNVRETWKEQLESVQSEKYSGARRPAEFDRIAITLSALLMSWETEARA